MAKGDYSIRYDPDKLREMIAKGKTAKEIKSEFGIDYPVATVNATKIAREVLGVPIVNTTMLGAVIRITGVIDKESSHAPLEKRFGRLGERNIQAMETAYKEVVFEEQ